jgi:hypothetical protein
MLLCFLQPAKAQGNLVYNGGFEVITNGSYAVGWTFNTWVLFTGGGNPGICAFLSNDELSLDPTAPIISQAISGLIPGDTYIISGDYQAGKDYGGASPTNASFGVVIDGAFVFEIAASPLGDWRHFSFSYTATSSSALLGLSSQINGTGVGYEIDNIAMSAVPEPSTSWLILLGGGLFHFARRACKKSSSRI